MIFDHTINETFYMLSISLKKYLHSILRVTINKNSKNNEEVQFCHLDGFSMTPSRYQYSKSNNSTHTQKVINSAFPVWRILLFMVVLRNMGRTKGRSSSLPTWTKFTFFTFSVENIRENNDPKLLPHSIGNHNID